MGGAVFRRGGIGVWVPPVGLGRTVGRVAGPAQHRAVGNVERRTTSGERHDVIDGQVARSVGVALVARAPLPVLASAMPATWASTGASQVVSPRRAFRPQASHGLACCFAVATIGERAVVPEPSTTDTFE